MVRPSCSSSSSGPVKGEWLAKLRGTGATVLGYAAQNGYIVHAEGDALDRVTELVGAYPAVRAATALRPGDKVERGASSGRVAVQTVAGEPGDDARDAAKDAGAEIAPELAVARVRTQFLDLSAAEVTELAADPAVVAIEPAGVPELHDERSAQIVAGNLAGNAPSGPGYEAWLVSKGFGAPFGFAIDVTDSGLDEATPSLVHPDLLGRVGYANDYTLDPDATDCGGHGTNVASIAAGLEHGRRPGCRGLQARPRRGALRAGRRLEDLPLHRRRRLGQLHGPHGSRLGRGRAHLEQLLGHLELRRLPRGIAGLRRPGARCLAGTRATRRWSRSSPPATTATATATRPTRRATRATAASPRRAPPRT